MPLAAYLVEFIFGDHDRLWRRKAFLLVWAEHKHGAVAFGDDLAGFQAAVYLQYAVEAALFEHDFAVDADATEHVKVNGFLWREGNVTGGGFFFHFDQVGVDADNSFFHSKYFIKVY